MPSFKLRNFLDGLGRRRQKDVFLLQIGAMDGKTSDPVHEYITRFEWSGLLVEPVPDQFERLEDTYRDFPSIQLANVAIAEHNGVISMHRVAMERVTDGSVPRWGNGLASFYKDRTALGFEAIEPFVYEEEVVCLTLSSLLAQYQVGKIDVMQIDAEGHDYHILNQMEFIVHRPLIINLEIVNLPKNEVAACKQLLDRFGYVYTRSGYDLVAVAPAFFREDHG